MMRTVEIGTQDHTTVFGSDEKDGGGASFAYRISKSKENKVDDPRFCSSEINFQNGPVGVVGVNGCHNEDLIAIVMDRLQNYQKGDYECDENMHAIEHLETALGMLNLRTASRNERGVEGTSEK